MNRTQNDSREADFQESRTPWRNKAYTERTSEKAGEKAGENAGKRPALHPGSWNPRQTQILNYAQGTTSATPWMTANSGAFHSPTARDHASPLRAKGYSGVK
jgi:hypothetical protein